LFFYTFFSCDNPIAIKIIKDWNKLTETNTRFLGLDSNVTSCLKIANCELPYSCVQFALRFYLKRSTVYDTTTRASQLHNVTPLDHHSRLMMYGEEDDDWGDAKSPKGRGGGDHWQILKERQKRERKKDREWESTAGSVRAEPPRSADSVTYDSFQFCLCLSLIVRSCDFADLFSCLYSIARTYVTNVADFGACREDFIWQVSLVGRKTRLSLCFCFWQYRLDIFEILPFLFNIIAWRRFSSCICRILDTSPDSNFTR